MHNHHYPGFDPHYAGYPPHAGLMGIIGGVINLATNTLYGGARIVRTVVEGSVWQAEYPHHYGMGGCHPQPCCHVCHVHCIPETYSCCGCC
jgi:hypothetical protein